MSRKIVLPASDLRGMTHATTGEQFISKDALITWLYKAIAYPDQHPIAAQTLAMLAESLEKPLRDVS